MIGVWLPFECGVADDVVHLLVDRELDVAVVADQRRHLEVDGDRLVGDGAGRGEAVSPAETGVDCRAGDDRHLLAEMTSAGLLCAVTMTRRGQDLDQALRAGRGGVHGGVEGERIDDAVREVPARDARARDDGVVPVVLVWSCRRRPNSGFASLRWPGRRSARGP